MEECPSPPLSLEIIRAAQAQIAASTVRLEKHLRKCSVAGVQEALESGADIHAYGRSENGKRRTTVLHTAIAKKSPELLRVLLDHGAPTEVTDGIRNTPLMSAAKTNQAWAIPVLLAAGADPNARDPQNGSTALVLALEAGNDDAVEALLVAGSRIGLQYARFKGDVPHSILFEVHTARSVKALISAGANPCEKKGDLQWSVADWLMAQSRNPAHARPHTRNVAPGVAVSGLVEMGFDDPAPALQALIDAGSPVTDRTLVLAARRALPGCLAVLDAEGLDWFSVVPEEGVSAWAVLSKENPDLADRWGKVLSARAQSVRLNQNLKAVSPTANRRPRV